MKTAIIPILLVILCVNVTFADQDRYFHVKKVFDGDTVLINTGEKIRYVGIDAPEIGYGGKENEFMALEARKYNSRMVRIKRISLELANEKHDHYGRVLAYVRLENGELLNALLVREGLAIVLSKRPNLKYRDLLIEDQRHAMARKAGIWQKEIIRPEKYYTGNKRSFRFHRPGCPFGERISRSNQVRFVSCYKGFLGRFQSLQKMQALKWTKVKDFYFKAFLELWNRADSGEISTRRKRRGLLPRRQQRGSLLLEPLKPGNQGQVRDIWLCH